MQQEIEQEHPGIELQILGVNAPNHESGNDGMCDGRSLPWLQDTEEQRVWETWAPGYRDVVLVDRENTRGTAYNLTSHSLLDADNYAELKALLLEAAEP